MRPTHQIVNLTWQDIHDRDEEIARLKAMLDPRVSKDSLSPGQVVFEGYYPDRTLFLWDGLDEEAQRGWEAAALALLSVSGLYLEPSDKGEPTTVRQWQKAIHNYAKSKGWWDEDKPRSFGDLCMLFVSEVAEAYEEYRSHRGLDEVYSNPEKPEKPEGIPVELADTVIRILDWFGAMGIDLQTILEQKHAYNQKRSYRHGNRKA